MKFTIEQAAYHRNGVGGAGFYVGIAKCELDGEELRMLVTYFAEYNEGEPCPAGKDAAGKYHNGRVAVICLDRLEEYGVEFGPNAWRGDDFYDVADAIVKQANLTYA